MGPDRGHDRYSVDVRRCEQLVAIVGYRHVGIGLSNPLNRLWTLVAHRDNAGMVLAMKVANDVWSPISITDDTHAKDVLAIFSCRDIRRTSTQICCHDDLR